MLKIIVLLIGLGLVGSPSVSVSDLSPNTLNLDLNEQDTHRQAIYEIIEAHAQEVAHSHDYKLHVFDCTEFSKELIKGLQEDGFNAYCMFGIQKTYDYPLHTWVEVDYLGSLIRIESTGGYIIDDEDYNENYKVRKTGGRCL